MTADAAPKASPKQNLALRLGSSAVLLPLVIWAIVHGGFAFALLAAVVGALCCYEILSISLGPPGAPRPRPLPPVGWLAVALTIGLPFTTVPAGLFERVLPLVAMGYLIASCAAALFSELEPALAAPELPKLLFGFVYAAGPFALLAALRALPEGGYWVFLACTVSWMNDTGAYFVGRAIGRHKLSPRVSPGKTWEGFFGGMALALAALFALRALGFHSLSALDCVALALPAGVLGPLGDLSESLIKRAYGVKDSGRALPGHGGILDRVDALIFNAPFVYLYAVALKGLPWH